MKHQLLRLPVILAMIRITVRSTAAVARIAPATLAD
jgi:hypothetical protein